MNTLINARLVFGSLAYNDFGWCSCLLLGRPMLLLLRFAFDDC